MQTINEAYTYTTEVNRSKFIAYLIPIKEYEDVQKRLKREHPKANHIVYALRYLNKFDQIVENSSDDGEPKGCAGVPSLNVLRGEELVDCARGRLKSKAAELFDSLDESLSERHRFLLHMIHDHIGFIKEEVRQIDAYIFDAMKRINTIILEHI